METIKYAQIMTNTCL